ncbi:prepilin-type N-terminal cleavage/methylation domain-containing protein [Candidatus Parabeggiatoa sp. HSG14]|uniref:prepilin-type N-terminal cleavage/methylation domain-containing protein n=1 Tax=Candidatus Parabeggiatoa sp. HSG14 TaxID=3055593 RepID=UPI0025A6B4B3|nr:prepilin-type N-terminal cleavage/methylation domain-containing protein [Thiotrichales bacterium HSG14]
MTIKGFSLIEVAIVLVIIGLLAMGLLTPIAVQMDLKKIKQTDKTLEKIKEALLGFAVINGRLPCSAPDKDKDKEGNEILEKDKGKEHEDWCEKEGFLPWKNLGVGRYDGWGNPFRYRAEDEYSKDPMILSEVLVKADETGSGLRIRNREIEDDSKSSPKKYFYFTTKTNDSRVVAVIFSHGKNGKPYDDDTNNDDNAHSSNRIFVYDGYIENKFDDRLTWLSRNTLMNRLLLAKKLPR